MSKRFALAETPVSVQNLNTLPDCALLDLSCIKAITGKSRPTIFRWVNKGILPKPRKLGATRNQWTAGEIRAALGIDQRGEV